MMPLIFSKSKGKVWLIPEFVNYRRAIHVIDLYLCPGRVNTK